jgi:P-type Cu+ transporter
MHTRHTPETHVLDPVCGMTVDPQNAAGTLTHDGVTYAFCSPRCQERFAADPARYSAPAVTTPAQAP